ncbi:MAG: hypothetical protein HY719_08245 [Planctomycetes bacterium]|nr:hypothetical protein [Planctomycetota bacterium]
MKKDIRDVIRGGSKKTTLDDLKKAGHQNVRVIDEQKIMELIDDAVKRAIGQKSSLLLDQEAAGLSGDARELFSQLLADHQKAMQVQEALARARALMGSQIEKVRDGLPDNKKGLEAGKMLDDVARQTTILFGKIEEKDGRERGLRGRVADLEAKLKNAVDAKSEIARLVNEAGEIDVKMLSTPAGKAALRHQMLELERLRADHAVARQLLDEARGFQQECTTRMVQLQDEVSDLQGRLMAAQALAGEAGISGGDALVAQLTTERDELRARLAGVEALTRDLVCENYALTIGETPPTMDADALAAAREIVVVV